MKFRSNCRIYFIQMISKFYKIIHLFITNDKYNYTQFSNKLTNNKKKENPWTTYALYTRYPTIQ